MDKKKPMTVGFGADVLKGIRILNGKEVPRYRMLFLPWDETLEDHCVLTVNGKSQRFVRNFYIKIEEEGNYYGYCFKFVHIDVILSNVSGEETENRSNIEFETVQLENPNSIEVNEDLIELQGIILVDMIYNGVEMQDHIQLENETDLVKEKKHEFEL